MTDQTQNTEDQTQDQETTADPAKELEMLKKRADQMGVKYSPKIGLDKLREKVNAAINGNATDDEDEDQVEDDSGLTERERKIKRRNEMVKEQMKLVRVRITNMDPSKADMNGDFYTVSNKILGKVSKYVPFDGEPYHLPLVLLNMLKTKKFLEKKVLNKPNGHIEIKTRFIKEFAIEELKPLTEKELEQLKRAQLAKEGL